MVNIKETLSTLYCNLKSPNSYGGIQSLLKNARKINPSIKIHHVIKFLKSQKAYTLHKLTPKKFLRRKTIASKPGVIASCDLADMSSLSRYNNGIKYILVFIDIFSRFAQATPLKKKDRHSIYIALKNILESGYFNELKSLNTDEGKEFYNKKVKDLLKSHGINLYSVSSREIKASIAERFIRTMKGKIYRYMTDQNTRKYVHILQDIIQSYNNSNHRGLGNDQTPNQIHELKDSKTIRNQFLKMYKTASHSKKSIIRDLSIGDYVRVSNVKPTFHRGYKVQNSEEIFKIKSIDFSQNPTIYYLEDWEGEIVQGIFYHEELIPVTIPEFFHIYIIKSKIIAGRKKYLVKWRGYPDKFNSWVDEDQLTPV